MEDEYRAVLVSLLDEPFLPMRPVLKNSVEYLERRDSVERSGFTNSILVRPSPRSPGRYEIIDGMWRFTAAVDIGLETIPCIIKHGLSDNDVLALQVVANEVRKDTTPTEVARHLSRIMARTPGISTSQLARNIGKHPTYVKDRLGLLKLDQEVQLMVDRSEIPAKSAYLLAKIPAKWRKNHVDDARVMTCKEFCALAASLIKQFTEYVQQGRMNECYLEDFKPHAYLRSLTEIEGEFNSTQVGGLILAAENCRTLMDAWKAALRWAISLDTAEVERRKTAALARQHKDLLAQENSHDTPPE